MAAESVERVMNKLYLFIVFLVSAHICTWLSGSGDLSISRPTDLQFAIYEQIMARVFSAQHDQLVKPTWPQRKLAENKKYAIRIRIYGYGIWMPADIGKH